MPKIYIRISRFPRLRCQIVDSFGATMTSRLKTNSTRKPFRFDARNPFFIVTYQEQTISAETTCLLRHIMNGMTRIEMDLPCIDVVVDTILVRRSKLKVRWVVQDVVLG